VRNIINNIIISQQVTKSMVGIIFMGQAGYIIKTSTGKLIAIDLYLSDCCERYFGFKRLMPKLIGASDIVFDIVICTHGHYDHLDIDSIGQLTSNERTTFFTTKDGIDECEKLGITNAKQISAGDTVQADDIKINAVYCDHGELCLDAVGIVFEIDGKKLYFTGDTAYKPNELCTPLTKNCDFLAVPINGAFGNANEEQAARLCSILKPKLTVPCHYWNFADHGGNPMLFMENMKKYSSQNKYLLMCQGEMIII